MYLQLIEFFYNIKMILPNEIKNGDVLRNTLPKNLIQKINNYIYRKNEQFIIAKMYSISSRATQQIYWQFFIRDSKNIKIKMNLHELDGFNFAHFLDTILSRCIYSWNVGPYLQQFCIQAIMNNPQLIYNRYYVGNGGLPAYQLISSYLIRRSINWTPQLKCPFFEEHLFNILKFVLDNKYIQKYRGLEQLYYSLDLGMYMTNRTVQTVDLIFSYLGHVFKFDIIDNLTEIQNDQENQFLKRINFFNFFLHIFENYLQKFEKSSHYNYFSASWNKYFHKNPEQGQKEKSMIKPNMQRILQLLDRKHKKIMYKLTEQFNQSVLKADSVKLVQYLLKYETFSRMMLDESFIYQIFSKRCMKLVEKLWNYRDYKYQITKMKYQGENILEFVAKSYGLTHNLISMLWQSGQFSHMPKIQNKKSAAIIKAKYNL